MEKFKIFIVLYLATLMVIVILGLLGMFTRQKINCGNTLLPNNYIEKPMGVSILRTI